MEVSKVTKSRICEAISTKSDADQLSQSACQVIKQHELLNSLASAGATDDVAAGFTGTLLKLLEGNDVRFNYTIYADTRKLKRSRMICVFQLQTCMQVPADPYTTYQS
jgi:hypothetical protein